MTADALAIQDSEGARTAPGVSPYSMQSGVPLPQMPGVVNFPAIHSEATLVPAQAREEILIAKVESTMNTKMGNLMKAFAAWTCYMRSANYPGYGGYQTARAYAIQADNPSPHTPTGLSYQPHPRKELGPCMYCDVLGHIRTFCHDVRTDQNNGTVYLKEHRRLTKAPTGGNEGEISGYPQERRLLSMREYARDVAQQW
jgi:hypothetical protein